MAYKLTCSVCTRMKHTHKETYLKLLETEYVCRDCKKKAEVQPEKVEEVSETVEVSTGDKN